MAKASRAAVAARARLAEQRAQGLAGSRRWNWIAGISVVVIVIDRGGGWASRSQPSTISPARTPCGTPQLGGSPSTLGKLQPVARSRLPQGPEGCPSRPPRWPSTSGAATGSRGGRDQRPQNHLVAAVPHHAHLTVFVEVRIAPPGPGGHRDPGAQVQDTPSGTFINGGRPLRAAHARRGRHHRHRGPRSGARSRWARCSTSGAEPLGTSQVGPGKDRSPPSTTARCTGATRATSR